MSSTYGVAILGNCCTHGEFVAADLGREPRARLVAGWEADPRRAPRLAAALGRELAATPEALLDDPDVAIVAIACSPHEKAGWVERCVAAGKHVLLNKPMAEGVASAERIERALAGTDVRLVYDIPAIGRFHPVTGRLLADVRAGRYGRPLGHSHSFSFTFSHDFPLAEVWPERLDPPARSGGGELTNLGCYAVDYMVGLWGRPRSIQAKTRRAWDAYREAGLESFGQVVADYGDFFAVLASGKQQLDGLPTMGVAEALDPRHWHNVLTLQFEHHNVVALPFDGVLIVNGARVEPDAFLDGWTLTTPFAELLRAIETGEQPTSDAASARLGVEVLDAAYRSAAEGGAVVPMAHA